MRTPFVKERGQGIVEYVLILSIIALAVIVVFALFLEKPVSKWFGSYDSLVGNTAEEHTTIDNTEERSNAIDVVASVALLTLVSSILLFMNNLNSKAMGKSKGKKRRKW